MAGDFVNLTFDAPILQHLTPPTIPNGPHSGPTSDIIPGWTLLSGGSPVTRMYFNPYGSYTGSSQSLLENSSQVPDTRFGRYSLFLVNVPPTYPILTLEQRGTIPSGAIGLSIFAGGGVTVAINNEKFYGAFSGRPLDVSLPAGQNVDIRIEIPAGPSGTGVLVDIFGFTYVPEPSTLELAAIGGVGLGVATCGRHSLFRGRKMRQDRLAKVAE